MVEKSSKIKKVAAYWERCLNPLRNLNNQQIERMLESARYGNDARLQICFFEIERSTPIFSACINKRIAGVVNRQWDITPTDDSQEAKAQVEVVKKMFQKSDTLVEDSLTEALRHLVLGSFRGRSAVKPFITADGLIFKKLDNWNFLRKFNRNYWVPDPFAKGFEMVSEQNGDIQEVRPGEICYVLDEKPVDWIGITIYLRQLICEESWARLIEKQGIPQILLTAPENTPEDELEKFNYRAQAIYEGASGVLPKGTEVTELNKGAQTDPFTNFITHQSELFCILATGGVLDTLAGTQGSSGTGMGSSTADRQNDQFQSLVNYDCKRISNALKSAVSLCVKKVFGKDAELRCRFEFTEQDDTPAEKYLELARQCKDLGITIDVSKLREVTKLPFISEDLKDVWTPERQDEEK